MCLFVSATCCSTGTKRCSPSRRSTSFDTAYRPAKGCSGARGLSGGARPREGCGCQHCLDRYPGTQLAQGAIPDLTRRRFLDKLDQRFDGGGKLDTLRHGEHSLSAVMIQGLTFPSLGVPPV